MTEAKGSVALAAKILGIDTEKLRDRIRGHLELNALWPPKKLYSVDPTPPVPNGATVIKRKGAIEIEKPPGTIELIEMVSRADKAFHHRGLKQLGFNDEALKRLKDLEGLARSSGHFIATALETMHRSYYVMALELQGVAGDLRKKLIAKPGEADYIQNDETRAFFNKNYIEMVRENGKAFELMLTATQAMVRMMMDTREEGPANGAIRKPKWGQNKREIPTDAET